MAIVRDKSGNDITDIGSYETHTRSNAGSPNGAVTPKFVGEVVYDSTNHLRYKAIGATSADWIALTTPTPM